MAVIDGRAKGQAAGATIAETAYIARLLGLTDALNLDGGGSSALWTAQEGWSATPATTAASTMPANAPYQTASSPVRGNKGAVLKRCPAQPPPQTSQKNSPPDPEGCLHIHGEPIHRPFRPPAPQSWRASRHTGSGNPRNGTACSRRPNRDGIPYRPAGCRAGRNHSRRTQPGMGSTPYRHYGRRHKRGHVHDERIHRHHAVQVGNQV